MTEPAAAPGGLPAALAQRQLDAYNAHDLEAFCACYAPDVQAWSLPDMALLFAGRDTLRARYGPYFQARRPHAALVGERITLGAFAIDVEAVRLADGTALDAIAIYQVEGDLIRRIWFIRG